LTPASFLLFWGEERFCTGYDFVLPDLLVGGGQRLQGRFGARLYSLMQRMGTQYETDH
jgi:hypothetical protein